jgi:hypothetical protein
LRKYVTQSYSTGIGITEIVRETEEYVYFNDGTKARKTTENTCYFDKEVEAYRHIRKRLTDKLAFHKMETHKANTKLGKFISQNKHLERIG